ncbi:MAG: agmatine deiminase family protein [Marinilabiliaceae bacterium]|nr:agmatine deiminase family protein [Marinilabiliaceae bacterium]
MPTTHTIFPAEWAPQSGVMLTWPHINTDWADILNEAEHCFINIAREILKREKLLIVCHDVSHVRALFPEVDDHRLMVEHVESNDTWARDHGPLTLMRNGRPVLLDFKFNGWGLKFASGKDNLITSRLFDREVFAEGVGYENHRNMVLEGGSLESDGEGTLLTTSECLLSPNRNDEWNRHDVEQQLIERLGVKRVLWLNHGYLAGDDTDSHVDTLARFCSVDTIAYVKCDDPNDEHFTELDAMEKELMALKQLNGQPYKLVPLPMADAVFYEEERIPATYANFLIINGAVLLPVYGSAKDREAVDALQVAFPDREIVPIDCITLIKQHGSLHCVTMQFPEGVLGGGDGK